LGHTGMLGDRILVNGTYAPYVEAPAKHIRLRVLNGSNARRYNFGFEDNRTFYQIATDGGFLESPAARTRMVLAPGERAEIVVDLSGETKPVTLLSYAVLEENPLFRFVKDMVGSDRDENEIFKILEIRPRATNVTSAPLPQTLNTIEKQSAENVVKTRRFVLGPNSVINDKKMDHKRIDEIARSGDVEIWEITNRSGAYHPFHIHGVQFLILDRNGKPPSDHERGRKDTVLVHNGETVRVMMRLPEHSNSHLPYMFHCHILEHEDMGMIGQFVVVDKATKNKDIYIKSSLKENYQEMPMH